MTPETVVVSWRPGVNSPILHGGGVPSPRMYDARMIRERGEGTPAPVMLGYTRLSMR